MAIDIFSAERLSDAELPPLPWYVNVVAFIPYIAAFGYGVWRFFVDHNGMHLLAILLPFIVVISIGLLFYKTKVDKWIVSQLFEVIIGVLAAVSAIHQIPTGGVSTYCAIVAGILTVADGIRRYKRYINADIAASSESQQNEFEESTTIDAENAVYEDVNVQTELKER